MLMKHQARRLARSNRSGKLAVVMMLLFHSLLRTASLFTYLKQWAQGWQIKNIEKCQFCPGQVA